MESSKITPKFNLPTILTLSRIVIIPVFLMITPAHPFWGAVVFGIASITDFLDGFLARRSGQITNFGIIMDPIADKFLVISALVLLVDMGKISVWIATIIIVREFLVTTLRVVALSKDIVIRSEMWGKLKTTAQISGILCLILGREVFNLSLFDIDVFDVGIAMIWVSLALAVISGVQYTIGFWQRIVSEQPEEPRA